MRKGAEGVIPGPKKLCHGKEYKLVVKNFKKLMGHMYPRKMPCMDFKILYQIKLTFKSIVL